MSSSLAGTAEAAAFGQSRQRRTLATRALWSESGRRGGVSDLGGGGQPTADASAALVSRSPLARTRNVAVALAHAVVTRSERLVRLGTRRERSVGARSFAKTGVRRAWRRGG